MKKILLAVAAVMLVSCRGLCQDARDLFPDRPGSLTVWTEVISEPRPLRISYLKVALTAPELEIVTLTGEDPDGPGPAESKLTQPTELFRKFGALAAVNANAYAVVSGDTAPPGWFEGRSVDVLGMAASDGKIISHAEKDRTTFWTDAVGKPHIGSPASLDSVDEAVSDWFSPLLIDSLVVPDPADKVLHPRTSVCFDDSGTWLLLVVVDGRQPGFSEGVSLYELAKILQSRNCRQSLNLDGGGSSIMLIREGEEIRTINSPSDKRHRPVPIMLGVRSKGKKE